MVNQPTIQNSWQYMTSEMARLRENHARGRTLIWVALNVDNSGQSVRGQRNN